APPFKFFPYRLLAPRDLVTLLERPGDLAAQARVVEGQPRDRDEKRHRRGGYAPVQRRARGDENAQGGEPARVLSLRPGFAGVPRRDCGGLRRCADDSCRLERLSELDLLAPQRRREVVGLEALQRRTAEFALDV